MVLYQPTAFSRNIYNCYGIGAAGATEWCF